MNKHMKSFIAVLLAILLMPFTVRAQEDSEAALLLDLKKTRADYEDVYKRQGVEYILDVLLFDPLAAIFK